MLEISLRRVLTAIAIKVPTSPTLTHNLANSSVYFIRGPLTGSSTLLSIRGSRRVGKTPVGRATVQPLSRCT